MLGLSSMESWKGTYSFITSVSTLRLGELYFRQQSSCLGVDCGKPGPSPMRWEVGGRVELIILSARIGLERMMMGRYERIA
jgi:hypothetical protein